jgi:hypothetical protein
VCTAEYREANSWHYAITVAHCWCWFCSGSLYSADSSTVADVSEVHAVYLDGGSEQGECSCQSHTAIGDQPVNSSWCWAIFSGLWPDFVFVKTVTDLPYSGVPSDDRTGLSFVKSHGQMYKLTVFTILHICIITVSPLSGVSVVVKYINAYYLQLYMVIFSICLCTLYTRTMLLSIQAWYSRLRTSSYNVR